VADTDVTLKPCPFCGSSDVYVQNAGWKANTFMRCRGCDSSFSLSSGVRGHDDTVAAWNRRSGEAVGVTGLRQHVWEPSTLGHGETVCRNCKITNREAAVLGELNECNALTPPVPVTTDADGWIEWNGGARPVPTDVEVFWRRRMENHRPNADLERESRPAGDLRWTHRGSPTDIIAYRVVTTHKDNSHGQ
jgi:Lar family restriction alleviation protein